MQLFCGAISTSANSLAVCEQLLDASAFSNSSVHPTIDTGSALTLGYVSRRYTTWQGEDPNLRLFLDGEVLILEGAALQSQGTTTAELAHVAQAYRRYGTDVWQHLDGNFCLVIEDGDTVHIGVDVVGTRTVYWWERNGMLAFHNYLMDLAPLYPGELTEDHGAIGTYLACGAYPPGRTPYNEIHHLSSGCYLTFAQGRVQVAEHFHMTCENREMDRSREETIVELSALLAESCGVQWQAAQRPAVLLSGGLDARYLAAEFTRQADTPSLVYTVSYGEQQGGPGDDGFIAAQVAKHLGVHNSWFKVTNDHQVTSFARTLYLTSGGDDSPTLYADHYLMHREMVMQEGFEAVFRGDHCFSTGLALLTKQAVLSDNHISRLALDPRSGYRAYISEDVFRTLAEGQAATLTTLLDSVQSTTLTGRRDEVRYRFRLRQVLGPSNRIKHVDMEVYNPYLSRRVLEWQRQLPDALRHGKKALLREALRYTFPTLATIPFATSRNQGNWHQRFQSDHDLLQFYRDWCAGPGWLDTIGAQQNIVATLDTMMTNAGKHPDAHQTPRNASKKAWKEIAKQSLPGRLYREFTHEHTVATQLPNYLRIGRLAILHGLLGTIQARRSQQVLEHSL